MEKIISLGWVFAFVTTTLAAQVPATEDSSLLISINQRIDNLVVAQQITALDSLYADDFVFSHGSGRIEGKQGWYKSVAKGGYLLRQHDSVTVELHPGLAVLRGKLAVQKKNATTTDRYHLKYVRVYAYRDRRWELVSHVTTHEYHEPKM